ncbi:MAG: DNA polymerase I [Acidobacteria bacterium]|nr:MAG: DNA polymerase I [Acidobacteriota bacterium]
MRRVFLIDGSSQMYRAYHAIRGLTAPDGTSTNAIYGFVTMLRKLIADHKPDFIAASFDLAGPTFRDELSDTYKATRAPMPPDLVQQAPIVREACEAMGVPVLTFDKFEADDVIGTLGAQARKAGYEVALVTGDKDFFQLVGDGVRVFNPKDDGTWYDAQGVVEKFGVRPDQVADVLALMGDSVDNIKGVPGIGDKGAKELIGKYGTLEKLIEAAPEITQKRYREGLLNHADDAYASRALATIRLDVPVTFDPDALRYRGPQRDKCYALFSKLGFRSLTAEFAPTAQDMSSDYQIVADAAAVEALAGEIRAAKRMSLAVIADGAPAVRASLVGLAISTDAGRGRYLPFAHAGLSETPNLSERGTLAALKGVLEDAAIAKIGHDLKYIAIVLSTRGITLSGFDTDVMVESYLIDAMRASHDLEQIAGASAGYRVTNEDSVRGKGAKALPWSGVPAGSLVTYAGERAEVPMRVAPALNAELAALGLDALYRDLERPLIPILAAIEEAGIKLDVAALAKQSAAMESELAALTAEIYTHAGGEFNIASPKQLSDVLFNRLNLTTTKRAGKSGTVSTAVDVLEELALTHELPGLILKWRGLQKLKGTYIDALPLLVNPATGRLHTTFNQAVAATGRLSSSDPNLQNIPIRTPAGREIRSAFIAEPGFVLISADYSQIELRVLAHLSGDAALTEAFQQGVDIHDRTAERVFGGAKSGLDPKELRRRAKIINYALLYGKTAFTLAKDIGVSQTIAQDFIHAYFSGYPSVRSYIDRTLAEARESGVVRTITGRRRLVPELKSANGMIRAAAERETVNMPIQGTAADILKKAMIDVQAALRAHGGASRMILTVHDELLFEAPEAEAGAIAALVRTHMEAAFTLSVPLTVDIGTGPNWNAAKP